MSERPLPSSTKKADQPCEASRRGFFRDSSLLLASAMPGGAAIGAHAATGAKPSASWMNSVNSSLNIGLVGCGRRGVWIASQLLQATALQVEPNAADSTERVPSMRLTVVADFFGDRIQQALRALKSRHGDQVQVDAGNRCVGLNGFAKLLQSDVDVVILSTPPYFRPQQFEAAIAANKHVYAETPIAVDVPGLQRFEAAWTRSVAEKLSVQIGMRETGNLVAESTCEQIRQGAIGLPLVVRVETCSTLDRLLPPQKSQTAFDFQLRNWKLFQWAGGDNPLLQQAAYLELLFRTLDRPVHSVAGLATLLQDRLLQETLLKDTAEGKPVKHRAVGGDIATHWSSLADLSRGGCLLMSHQTRHQVPASLPKGNLWSLSIVGDAGQADLKCGAIREVGGDKAGKVVWKATPDGNTTGPAELRKLIQTVASGAESSPEIHSLLRGTKLAILNRIACREERSVSWLDEVASKQTLQACV